MMASKSAPHLQGFRVMSKVHRSKMRCRTAYCAAARMIPGCASGGSNSMSVLFGLKKGFKSQTFPTHLPAIDVRAEYESTEISGRLACQDILISVDDKSEKPSITSYVGHTASPDKRVIN